MSYTIEVYKGNQKAEKHLGIYALYVMFYPQLVAGPIERPQNILHQFHETKVFNLVLFKSGLRLILWGLFKKVVISDRLAIYVNLVYEHPEHYHYINLLLAVLLFSIQIYCDFSGYSDIAIGSARTMGYELMTNFNRPYFAKNIQEFWAKWHISISTWFRDYVYIPLGGNRNGKRKMYLSLVTVFLLSGLWHGANWTFLAWGLLHAVFMVSYLLYKGTKHRPLTNNFLINIFSVVVTFVLVSFAWIYFRAESITKANDIIGYLFSMNKPAPFVEYLRDIKLKFIFNKFSLAVSGFFIVVLFLIENWSEPNMSKFDDRPKSDYIFNVLVILAIIFFGVFRSTSFIYFQF